MRPQLGLDELSYDSAVGLACEGEALGFELAPQSRMVVDDPVMYDRDAIWEPMWGWALRSVGLPCVAQRVCPIPAVFARGAGRTASSSASLPAFL